MSTENEINILIEKNTPRQLAEQLQFYKNLDRIGNVYYQHIPNEYVSLRQMLYDAMPTKIDLLKKMLNISFTKTPKNQERSIQKYNIHRTLLILANKLAVEYRKEYKTCATRIKQHKHTDEILDGKIGMSNCYPKKYIKHVKEFLKHYPIEKWVNEFVSKIRNDFTQVIQDEVEKYQCKYCEKVIMKNSRTGHIKVCKKKPN
jgi:hypothetical protein